MSQPLSLIAKPKLACSKRSDSGERCEVKKAMKSRGGLGREVPLPLPRFYFFALLFISHRSPLSERLEQAKQKSLSILFSLHVMKYLSDQVCKEIYCV